MRVSDRAVARFPQLLGKVWVQEAVGNDVDQLGLCRLCFFSLVADYIGDRVLASSLGVSRPTPVLD